MRKLLTWLMRIGLAFVLAALVVGLWKREEITRLLAVNSLFDEGRIVENFSHMDRAFLTVPVPRGDGPVSKLPEGPQAALPEQLDSWTEARDITSLLVMKKGQVVHESYHMGTGELDRRISWSMAKSYLSVLFGILLEEGAIGSLYDEVTRYAPVLQGSAYEGVSIRNVLQMTSGIFFDEDYLDYDSDINRMGRVLALGGTMDGFAAGLTEREAAPGARWQYVSIDTHVLGMVIRGATGRDIPSLLSEKVIQPMGLEAEPYYLSDGEGVAFVLGGLNLTTRDYARFGQMVLQNGRWNGRQIVSPEWIDASTAPSAPTAPGRVRYGYQWWLPAQDKPGVIYARGIYGQYIYIDRAREVVIVVTAADRGFRDDGVHEANMAIFEAIASAL